MAYKTFALNSEGKDALEVSVYKRRGARHIKLTVAHGGKIRVTIPHWVPYKAGLKFAKDKQAWIEQHASTTGELVHNQPIGKTHTLVFLPEGPRLRTRIIDNQIRVYHRPSQSPASTEVQKAAHAAAYRALKAEANKLLPPRLKHLADFNGFSYKNVTIKRMTSRWGSCDAQSNITLSLFLMQLPWELIDYVLLHELTHTKLMKHGPEFWQAMAKILPDVQARRKEIKRHKPSLV